MAIDPQFTWKCLENIELARIHEYPVDKVSKLNEREEKCKKLLEESKNDAKNDPRRFFKLSYPSNEKIPFIVNCLELGESGRYIVTMSDLKSGDIIAIEDPFFKHIRKEAYISRCANCLKANDLSCADCTTSESILQLQTYQALFKFISSHALLQRCFQFERSLDANG